MQTCADTQGLGHRLPPVRRRVASASHALSRHYGCPRVGLRGTVGMLGGFTNTVARLFGDCGVSCFVILARRADTCNRNHKKGKKELPHTRPHTRERVTTHTIERVTTHTRHGVVIPFCIIKTVNGELALCHRACSHLDYNTELCFQCLEFFHQVQRTSLYLLELQVDCGVLPIQFDNFLMKCYCIFRHFFFDICELHTRTLSLADI